MHMGAEQTGRPIPKTPREARVLGRALMPWACSFGVVPKTENTSSFLLHKCLCLALRVSPDVLREPPVPLRTKHDLAFRKLQLGRSFVRGMKTKWRLLLVFGAHRNFPGTCNACTQVQTTGQRRPEKIIVDSGVPKDLDAP